eukprot:jgi/Chlat1/8648/Chrsp87S08052
MRREEGGKREEDKAAEEEVLVAGGRGGVDDDEEGGAGGGGGGGELLHEGLLLRRRRWRRRCVSLLLLAAVAALLVAALASSTLVWRGGLLTPDIVCALSTSSAAALPPQPHARLAFSAPRFRIVQFSDLHFANGRDTPCRDVAEPWSSLGPCTDLNTTDFMRAVLDIERPDLVVMSGDNIHGSTSRDPAGNMREVRKPMEERSIPYALIFGNHDAEGSLTRAQLMEVDVESPHSLSHAGPDWLVSSTGRVGNYAYTVSARTASDEVGSSRVDDSRSVNSGGGDIAWALYFLDSGAYDWDREDYSYVLADQVQWFRSVSSSLPSPVPSIAFVHIPLPEYAQAGERCALGGEGGGGGATGELLADMEMEGKGRQCTGSYTERTCSPRGDCGLFQAMAEGGSVKMVNCGHDHVNDFCAERHGISLCYAGGVGYNGYGRPGWERRARVIELGEDGSIFTYKRLDRTSQPPFQVIDEQWIAN